MRALIVKDPFEGMPHGTVITDPAEIAAWCDGARGHHFHPVNLPDPPRGPDGPMMAAVAEDAPRPDPLPAGGEREAGAMPAEFRDGVALRMGHVPGAGI